MQTSKYKASNIKHGSSNIGHRILALFLTITVILPSITPYNKLWANNNGPNAPEAASFEPVDATDMVNLLTGDFSYVLPLMNVPSPEGGYPIALSYHGGVAMDLESSWVGLGWNLNPGAINRTVNGYPDDYNHSKVVDYFYDTGGQSVTYFAGVSYVTEKGSVGVGVSWGSNQSLSGSVSVGYGVVNASVGTQGASIGVGVKFDSGLSLGASLSSDGTVDGNVGFNNNETGFSIGAASDGTYGFSISDNSISLGMNLSSKGTSLTLGVSKDIEGNGGKSHKVSQSIGIGANTTFSSTMSQGDYTWRQSGYNIPIMIPTKVGIFGFSFGRQKIEYFAAKLKSTFLSGPLYYNEILNTIKPHTLVLHRAKDFQNSYSTPSNYAFFSTLDQVEDYASDYEKECVQTTENNYNNYAYKKHIDRKNGVNEYYICNRSSLISLSTSPDYNGRRFMDTYEIPLSESVNFAEEFQINKNNPIYPAYDNYNVNAQGLSGAIRPTLVDNGVLFGLSEILKQDKDTRVNYYDMGNQIGVFLEKDERDDKFKFSKRAEFYFENEYSTYQSAPIAEFNNASTIVDQSNFNSGEALKSLDGSEPINNRFKKSNHIEYITNFELLVNKPRAVEFLKPNTHLNRGDLPLEGIGAYKITAVDGKTYHYSLPVYNHETITRTYGLSKENPKECESYLEKRQLEPYATHWLLTAVTGPDFVDNGDGIAADGDLGYWVNFDYGLWSDAYVWSPHPDEEYIEDVDNPEIKTWAKGRKQLYYLDKISTRTHTAVFIKSEDQSNPSIDWKYKSVFHGPERQYCDNFIERFHIPSHKRLKLDNIFLLKNEDFKLAKNDRIDDAESTTVIFPDFYGADGTLVADKIPCEANYNLRNNVYDITDNIASLRSSAIKEVVFDQDYQLSNNQLTLNTVDFKGKQGANVLPPYHFEYIKNNQYTYNKEDANDWGYYKENPELWSLETITTPQGADIKIEYEDHSFRSVTNHDFEFKSNSIGVNISNNKLSIKINSNINLQVGNIINLSTSEITRYPDEGDCEYDHDRAKTYCDFQTFNYRNEIIVEEIISKDPSQTTFTAKLLEGNVEDYLIERTRSNIGDYVDYEFTEEELADIVSKDFNWNTITYNSQAYDNIYEGNAGSRVKSIKTSDGLNSYTSQYDYGENGDGLGWVAYVPYAPKAQKEIPYSTELPPSRPMYEYVRLYSKDNNENSIRSTVYHFNVLKSKEDDQIKYKDFYELTTTNSDQSTNGKKTVSINEYTINDNLNTIGQLLSVSSYNSKDQLLSKLSNEYYKPAELPEKMGVTQESYQSYKRVIYDEGESSESNNWMVNSSTRVRYPNIIKSSTELKNGVSYTTTFSDFDPVSGQAKETHSKSSLGLELKTVSEPAFYHYPEMGSKADNVNNKNMLSQAGQTLTYFKDRNSTDWELYGAEVDTWKPYVYDEVRTTTVYNEDGTNTSSISLIEKNIWRKHQNYVWKSDLNESGSYQNFTSFNYDSENQAEGWQRLSEITKYSDYSKALETMDINGNKASRRMADNNSKVSAVCNAPQNAMVYTDFEYKNDFELALNGFSSQGIHLGNITLDNSISHTGNYCFKTSEAYDFQTFIGVPGLYKASVWAHKDNYQNTLLYHGKASKSIPINSNEIIEAGDWIQLNFSFEIQETSHMFLGTTSGIVYFDDFRIHPIDSSITSYVYNDWDELSYIIGPNNMATKYEYDSSGRLIKTYKEVAKNDSTDGGFKLINETTYNYKNQ